MARFSHLYLPRQGEAVPAPPPTKENWLAGGVHLIAAVLALFSFPVVHLYAVFGLLYGVGLAAGAWLVRPEERRRRIFPLLMLPLLLQAAIYIVYWYPIATFAMSGADGTGPIGSPMDTPAQAAALQATITALIMGWAPSVLLLLFARRAQALLAAQIAGPLLAVVFYVLMWVGI